MHKRVQTIALLLVATLLSACSTFSINPAIKTENLESIGKIGVVCLLDNTFHGIHIGTTIFNNKYYTEDIAHWNVGETLANHSAAWIADKANQEVEVVALTEEERLSFLRKGRSDRVDYEKLIDFSKARGYDSIIIYRGVRYENEPFHRTPYGFFQRKIFNLESSSVYSLFIVEAYSIRTQKQIGWHWGFPYGGEIPEVEWKPNFADFNEEEVELLKERLLAQVRSSIDTAFEKLFSKDPANRSTEVGVLGQP